MFSQIFWPSATISCLAASLPAPGVQKRRKQNRFGSLHCASLLILLFEVLLFGFLITQCRSHPVSSDFFLWRHVGGQKSVQKQSMCARCCRVYFMTSATTSAPAPPAIYQLPARAASTAAQAVVSSQQQVHAHQLARSSTASTTSTATTAQRTKKRRRKQAALAAPVCRCSADSRRTYLGIGAELTSPI